MKEVKAYKGEMLEVINELKKRIWRRTRINAHRHVLCTLGTGNNRRKILPVSIG